MSRKDTRFVGAKCANLCELFNLDINIPKGFCLLTAAQQLFMSGNAFQHLVCDLYSIDNEKTLIEESRKLSQHVLGSDVPGAIERELRKALNELADSSNSEGLVIRSSATIEDGHSASCAGLFDSFLRIYSWPEIIHCVKRVWTSLFSPRAIQYIKRKYGNEPPDIGMAVVIQEMINSEKSGVLFTVDPMTRNQSTVIIESCFGTCDLVVSGRITPAQHRIRRNDLSVIEKHPLNDLAEDSIDHKAGINIMQLDFCLHDCQAVMVAEAGIKIEQYFQVAQDVEWTIDNQGMLYILQSRPVT